MNLYSPSQFISGTKMMQPFNRNWNLLRSVGGTFTAIAQQFERGKIASLDDPVNKYLKRVQLKSFAGKQVTIWDMMTHQGGLGPSPVFVPDEKGPLPVPPLPAEYIASKMPDVVREP